MNEKKKGPSPFIVFMSAKMLQFVKFLKVAKFGAILITFGSMSLSFILYAFMLGWQFAAGLVIMLFIHEMGHVLAMKVRNYPTKAPVFIPFFGAAIFVPGFKGRDDEAFIGIMGPIIGSLAGLLLYAFWYFTSGRSEIVLAISHAAIYINLFNLIPVRPLDGGRVMQAVGLDYLKYLIVPALFVGSVITNDFTYIALLMILLLSGDIKVSLNALLTISILIFSSIIILIMHDERRSLGGDWLTIVGASLFLGIAILKYYFPIFRSEEDINSTKTTSDTSQLKTPQRIYWGVAYCLLVGILTSTLISQSQFLPDLKNHSSQKDSHVALGPP